VANRINAYSKEAYTVTASVQKDITSKSDLANTSNIYEDILFQYKHLRRHFISIHNRKYLRTGHLFALQQLRCYTLPYETFFDPIIRTEIVSLLAKRHTRFEEILLETKFKRNLGFYAFKIIKLCMAGQMMMPFR
jgi:hypothetical protein